MPFSSIVINLNNDNDASTDQIFNNHSMMLNTNKPFVHKLRYREPTIKVSNTKFEDKLDTSNNSITKAHLRRKLHNYLILL